MILEPKSQALAAAILALSHLISPSNAQRDLTPAECSARVNETSRGVYRPTNATRVAPFSPYDNDDDSESWYISTACSAPATQRDLQLQFAIGISAPKGVVGAKEGNDTSLCAWAFPGVNKKFASDDDTPFNSTCDGVLSAKCQHALRKLSAPAAGSCPSPLTEDGDGAELRDACDGMAPNLGLTVKTPGQLDGTSVQCPVEGYPELEVPRGYETVTLFTQNIVTEDIDFLEAYDAYSREPIPVLLQLKPAGEDDFKALLGCLPTDQHLADGSRKPEGKFPHGKLGNEDGNGAASRVPSSLALAAAVALAL